MDYSPKTLQRGLPVQRSSSADGTSAEVTTAIEKYARGIFHELLRIQHSKSDGSEFRKRYISAFTFWQFSKMPKLLSNRLFQVMSDQRGWSCTDLIRWMSLEIRGSLQDQLKITFQMLDGNKEGLVSREECETVLTHAIANPQKYGQYADYNSYQQQQQARSKIVKLIDQIYQGEVTLQASFQEYAAWYHEGKWELHDAIWDCITESLKSCEKIKNFMKLTRILRNSCEEEKDEPQEKKISLPQVIHEGKVYSMTDDGLRSSYFKIINSELYQFSKKENAKYKYFTYLGHGACVVPFTPQFQTIQNEKIYGLKIVSGFKALKFYLLGEENYLQWKKALEEATGSKAEIRKDYTFKEDIGKGKHGDVKSAVCNKTGKKVAIKVINKLDMGQWARELVKEEINVQRMCKHPNLVQILDVYEDLENVYLVLELMEGKSLMHYCSEKKEEKSKIENKEMMCIIVQLARALEYLKSFNIVHRDVKAENVLLTGRFLDYEVLGKQVRAPEVKLSDFSVSTIITTRGRTQFCGTLTHIAPEILEGMKYSFEVDMFSFGVLIYKCVTGNLPFFHSQLDKLKAQIKYGEPRNMEGLKISLPNFMFMLISRLLKKRVSERLDIDRLVSLPQLIEITRV